MFSVMCIDWLAKKKTPNFKKNIQTNAYLEGAKRARINSHEKSNNNIRTTTSTKKRSHSQWNQQLNYTFHIYIQIYCIYINWHTGETHTKKKRKCLIGCIDFFSVRYFALRWKLLTSKRGLFWLEYYLRVKCFFCSPFGHSLDAIRAWMSKYKFVMGWSITFTEQFDNRWFIFDVHLDLILLKAYLNSFSSRFDFLFSTTILRWQFMVGQTCKYSVVLEQRQFFRIKIEICSPIIVPFFHTFSHSYTHIHERTHTYAKTIFLHSSVNYESWLTSRSDVLFVKYIFLFSIFCSLYILTRAHYHHFFYIII